MTRKVKALGLALVAVFAMGALVAQGAQAHEFKAASAPAVITGEFDPGPPASKDVFTIEEGAGLSVSCESGKFEGTQATSPTPSLTITPTYGSTTAPTGCVAAGAAATVHTQHCAYVFSGTTNEAGDAAVEVECEGASENEILVTVPALGVTLHIAAQKPGGGVHYTNVETGGHKEVTVTATAKEIKTTCTGLGCFFVGSTVKTKYEGKETVKGFKDTCSAASGTAKTTPSLASCEGEQTNVEVNPGT
jgi:hypothetical protein